MKPFFFKISDLQLVSSDAQIGEINLQLVREFLGLLSIWIQLGSYCGGVGERLGSLCGVMGSVCGAMRRV